MGPSSPRARWSAPLAAFTLSAALAFALVRPGAPEAGAGGVPPLAVSGPVRLYGELARSGEGFAVQVRAVNGGDVAQRCRITATVTELRDSPMSRVVRAPQPIWTTEVALGVRGLETAEDRLAIPAEVSARLREASPPATGEGLAADELLLRETISHRVMLRATCLGRKALG